MTTVKKEYNNVRGQRDGSNRLVKEDSSEEAILEWRLKGSEE